MDDGWDQVEMRNEMNNSVRMPIRMAACLGTAHFDYIVNPHQRCGYSDSPFARKDTFLYCRVHKWVGEGGQ